MDYTTDQCLSYDEMKRRVLNIGELEPPMHLKYNHMIRPNLKRGLVHTKRMDKIYRPVISKGMILNDLRVVPFGFEQ